MLLSHVRRRVINGYQHIMACNFVKGWVVLIVVHFVVQVTLQGVTFRDNEHAKDLTSLCLSLAQVPSGLPLLERDNLTMCDGIPGRNNVTCILLVSGGMPSPPSPVNDMDSSALTDFDLDDIHNITLSGTEHFITGRCAMSLQWIHDVFRDNAAEDIATICFQFWLLIVSLLAVLQDSIPHLAVCIASHLLDVGWAGFRIKSTIMLRQDYYEFVVGGACGGEDFLGNWWDQRLAHAAPLLGTNVITLILLGALAIILFRRFARNTFSRVGASPSINRMYKIALLFSVFSQLAAFFTIMAVGMWIDRISDGTMNVLVEHIRLYQAAFIVVATIIAPWIISGWWAVFREIEWAFILFGVLHAFIFVLWPTMFASTIYRYIFGTWSFFAGVSVTSYLFVIATTIAAIICRLHFGRGLEHFLRVEATLSSSGFPASYFTNDPTHPRDGSPMSFDFNLLDTEKMRKGSEDEKEGPMHIRPYTLDSSGYSMRSLTFETSTNGSKIPVMTSLPPPGTTSAAIIQTLKIGSAKIIPKANSKPESPTESDSPKSTIFARDKKNSWIQPPPEAYLQAPYKETRLRKDTPSLMTQATGTSTGSYSQAVITFARKNPFASATAKTLLMDTISSKNTPSPGEIVYPREDRPSTDSGNKANINMGPQQRPILVRTVDGTRGITQFPALASWEVNGDAGRDVPSRANSASQPDNRGRI